MVPSQVLAVCRVLRRGDDRAMRLERFRAMPSAERWRLAALFAVPHAAFHLWTLFTWGSLGGPQMLDALPFHWAHRATWVSRPRFRPSSRTRCRRADLSRNFRVLLGAACPLAMAAAAVASLVIPMSAYDAWWAGFSPAARYLVPTIPFLAVAMAESLRFRAFRLVLGAFSAVQVAFALYAWGHPRVLWPAATGNTLLEAFGPYRPRVREFPSALQTGEIAQALLPVGVTVLGTAALLGIARRS